MVAVVIVYLVGQSRMEGSLLVIAGITLLLALHLVWQVVSGCRSWADFGLSPTGAKRAMPLLISATIVLVGFGTVWGKGSLSEMELHTAFLILAVYLPWGCVQTFLFHGLFHEKWLHAGHRTTGWIATTLLFVAAHYPSRELMLWTLPGGIIASFAYARARSIWPIGIFHGLAGPFLYFVVLGREPILRM